MNYWPGTNIPKSNGNAFTYWKSGEPSKITSSKEWKMSQASTRQIHRTDHGDHCCDGGAVNTEELL